LPTRHLTEKSAAARRIKGKYVEIECQELHRPSKHLPPECVFGRLKCRVRPLWEPKPLQFFLRRLQRPKPRGRETARRRIPNDLLQAFEVKCGALSFSLPHCHSPTAAAMASSYISTAPGV